MDVTAWQLRLRLILGPIALLYAGLMRLRRMAYALRLKPSYRPLAQVVSVGNISWGGSGKTPVCSWLLDRIARAGLKGALITRGYKARPDTLPLPIGADTKVAHAGDEPLMLARTHPLSRIVVDPIRSRAAAFLEHSTSPDILILDDGFQHLAVRRDLDLVLLRPVDLAGQWNRVIPAGSWREGASALRAADAFLVKAGFEEIPGVLDAARNHLAVFNKPVFVFTPRATGLVRLEDSRLFDPEPGQPYLLFSGVGSPESVAATAKGLMGGPPLEHMVFPDHHRFRERDLARIEARAAELGAMPLCTAKDAVKISPERLPGACRLDMDIVFGPRLWSDDDFPAWIAGHMELERPRRSI